MVVISMNSCHVELVTKGSNFVQFKCKIRSIKVKYAVIFSAVHYNFIFLVSFSYDMAIPISYQLVKYQTVNSTQRVAGFFGPKLFRPSQINQVDSAPNLFGPIQYWPGIFSPIFNYTFSLINWYQRFMFVGLFVEGCFWL